jgi:hypothetical protein
MVVKAVSRINNSVAIVCLISYKVPKRTDIRHSIKHDHVFACCELEIQTLTKGFI